jgi:hypothetical protein
MPKIPQADCHSMTPFSLSPLDSFSLENFGEFARSFFGQPVLFWFGSINSCANKPTPNINVIPVLPSGDSPYSIISFGVKFYRFLVFLA